MIHWVIVCVSVGALLYIAPMEVWLDLCSQPIKKLSLFCFYFEEKFLLASKHSMKLCIGDTFYPSLKFDKQSDILSAFLS